MSFCGFFLAATRPSQLERGRQSGGGMGTGLASARSLRVRRKAIAKVAMKNNEAFSLPVA